MTASSAWKSTIVRSVVHGAFTALDVAAPAVGAHLVNRLWFRLPPQPPSTEHPTGSDGPRGTPFEVQLRGRAVRGWVWGEGPLVYLVHGWSGTVQQLAPLVGPLIAQGLRVVGFDGLSHGRSDAGAHGPRSSDAVELGRSLDAVFGRFGPARGIVAHSMGALSTLLALRDGWVGAERLVLIAPVTGVPDFVGHMRARLGFADRIESRLARLAHARTGYRVEELDVSSLAAQIERPRLLVVHDEHDRETPHAGSVGLTAGWEAATLHTTSGLGHRRVLADPGVADVVARFLAEGDAAAPSRGDGVVASDPSRPLRGLARTGRGG